VSGIVQDQEAESKMQALSRRSERQARERLAAAAPPEVQPFPARVVAGLWLGILSGALLGLLFGGLLRSNTIVVPGWEGLYSMGPFTFHVFWLFAGVAVGIIAAALLTLLPEPGRRRDDQRSAAGQPASSRHRKE